MAGFNHQFGFAIESTPGTRVAPTKFVRATSSTLKANDGKIVDDGIIAGARTRRIEQYCDGASRVGGSVLLPLFRGTELRTLVGAMGFTETGAGTSGDPYVYVPGAPQPLTIQEGVPGTDGVVHPVDFLGSYITDWTIQAQVGQKARLELSIVSMDEVTDQSLAVASYATPVRTYSFVHANATVGGAARKITALNLSGTTGLNTDQLFLGSPTIDVPVEEGDREYKGDLQVQFQNLTDKNSFDAGVGTSIELVATFTDGVDVLRVELNGFLEETPLPDRGDRGALTSPIRLMGAGATDAEACTITQYAA